MPKRGTTTVGLPITSSRADQAIKRKLDGTKTKRGFRNRTDYIRTLIMEDADRHGVK